MGDLQDILHHADVGCTSCLIHMPDMSYRVTKINQYGKRQHRNLKLTSEGVENIRPGGRVSSFHLYSDLLGVDMKNLLTFQLRYRDAKHAYVYKSEVAMQIVQEINSRLTLLKQTRVRVERKNAALTYQNKLRKEGALSLDLDDIMMPPELRGEGDLADIAGLPVREFRGSIYRGSLMARSPSEKKSGRANKLEQLTGHSQEQRLAQFIDRILLERSGAVGKALRSFSSNFGVLEKNPATLLPNVRLFMDSLRNYILDHHEEELSKLLTDTRCATRSVTDPILSNAVETSIEKTVVRPLKSRLLSNMAALQDSTESARLEENLLHAQSQSQSFFGIKEDLRSPSDWFAPIQELRLINDLELPSEQLAAVLKAAKTVYSLVNFERNKRKDPSEVQMHFVSADDFFPIFIYAAARSDLRSPLLLTEYLMGVCDPLLLSGEAGYYLTVLSSAFEYLKNLHKECSIAAPGEGSAALMAHGAANDCGAEGVCAPACIVDLRGSFDFPDSDDDSLTGKGCIFSDYERDDACSSDDEAMSSEADVRGLRGADRPPPESLVRRDNRLPPEPLLRSDKDVFSPLSQSEPVVPGKRLDAEPLDKRSHTGFTGGSADPRRMPARGRRAWVAGQQFMSASFKMGSASIVSPPRKSSSAIKSRKRELSSKTNSMELVPLMDVRDAREGVFELEGVEVAADDSGRDVVLEDVVINFGVLSYHADGKTAVIGSVDDEV